MLCQFCVLQCLSVVPEFWGNIGCSLNKQTPFVSSFLKTMSLLQTSRSALDPSQFLRFLKQVLIKSGRVDFNIFQQQDACEVLSCILDELCSQSFHALDLIKTHVKNSITCNSCFHSNTVEDPFSILQIPICNSVQQAITSFLKSEELQGDNMYFCNFCSSLQPASLAHEFTRVGNLLIIQLKRFVNIHNSLTKDIRPVKCNQEIVIPLTVDSEVISHKKFKLQALINHSGTLERGHYTALIRKPQSSIWIHCNDTAVFRSKQSIPPQDLCYILLYRAA